jgi:hypothetical protein
MQWWDQLPADILQKKLGSDRQSTIWAPLRNVEDGEGRRSLSREAEY